MTPLEKPDGGTMTIAVSSKSPLMRGAKITQVLRGWIFGSIAFTAAAPALAADATGGVPINLPGLVQGDEPVVMTSHAIAGRQGRLTYTAMVGRLPIRDSETGQVRGWLGFTAYKREPQGGTVRPLTFVWNGGGATNSVLTHTVGFGPRVLAGSPAHGMEDNPDTLLETTDLVFLDPMTTGFSRPARPEFTQAFLTTLGDIAVTDEFIRQYRARFGAARQPLFLIGESFGTWRAAGVQEAMAKRGDPIAGSILISASGALDNAEPESFTQASYIQPRTAAALYFRRLSPDLMRDPPATLNAAAAWAFNVYRPALDSLSRLTANQRAEIAKGIARFTGVAATSVDPVTLTVTNLQFRKSMFPGDPERTLNMLDLRDFGDIVLPDGKPTADYLREELGYATDLTYIPEEKGYTPPASPDSPKKPGWILDQRPDAQAETARRVAQGGGPSPGLPWIENSLHSDKHLRVMIAIGRYDSLNGCGTARQVAAGFAPDIAARFVYACYEGGHMMYMSRPIRARLSDDIQAFMRETLLKRAGAKS